MENQTPNIYRLKDPLTGYVVTVGGTTPPSQQQMENIFQRAGLRKNQHMQGQQKSKPTAIGGGNLADQVAGGIGGTIGQAVGTPFDALTGPAGTMGGGAIGGAIGQGGAEAIQELLKGKGLNLGDIASQGAQGAALGAIPGVEEERTAATGGEIAAKSGLSQALEKLLPEGVSKLLPKQAGQLTGKNLLTRAALRAGTGAAGTGTAQAIQNISQGKPWSQNVPQTALSGAAVNTLIPGVTSALGRGLKAIPPAVYERTVGGPIRELQQLFDQTANKFVGSNTLPYALQKGIIPAIKDSEGKLIPEGLMTADSVDESTGKIVKGSVSTALDKRKQVSRQVEKEIQELLPGKEKPISSKKLDPIINKFLQSNYGADLNNPLSMAQAKSMFLAEIQDFAKQTNASDPIDTDDLMGFLSGAKPGSVKQVNQLKRVAGRGYNNMNPNTWNTLYSDLRGFVEKNSSDPEKVFSLNREHSLLRNMRISMSNFTKPGTQYPVSETQALEGAERARFGPTIGLSGERGMSVPLLIPQALAMLGGGYAGYKLGQSTGTSTGGTIGGISGAAVAPYLLAGSMREVMSHLLANPDVQETVARAIEKGSDPARTIQSLLQQLLMHGQITGGQPTQQLNNQ